MKKIILALLITMFMIFVGCSSGETTNNEQIVDIRGVNPATIKPKDSYNEPRGKYMNYDAFLKIIEDYAEKNHYTMNVKPTDCISQKATYIGDWESFSTGTTYQIWCSVSGNYIKECQISIDNLNDNAVEAEFTNLCEFFTNIFDDFEDDGIYRKLNFYDLKAAEDKRCITDYRQYILHSYELSGENNVTFEIKHLLLGWDYDFE